MSTPVSSNPDAVAETDVKLLPPTSGKTPDIHKNEASSANVPAPPATFSGQFEGARKSPKGAFGFMKYACDRLTSSLLCTFLTSSSTLFPLGLLVIGIYYRKDCPKNDYIPIYLIGEGIIGLFRQVLGFYYQIKKRKEQKQKEKEQAEKANTGEEQEEEDPECLECSVSCGTRVQFLLYLLSVVWFIVGSVWVYQAFKPGNESSKADYCNPVLYYCAFSYITFIYTMLCLGVLVVCCCISYFMFK